MKKIFTLLAILCVAHSASLWAQSHHHKHHADQGTTTDVNQYGMTVTSTPVKAELQDGFLVFQNKNAGYRLWFDIRVQTDAAIFWGEPEGFDKIGNGASLRRARFAVKGQLNEDWYGEVDLDFGNGSLELKDAYMRFDGVPNMAIQVGNFKECFAIQTNTTSRYLQFIERPMATAFAPSRHLGAQVSYNLPMLCVAAGAFLQPIEGQEAIDNVQDNNKDFGRSTGHSFTGKIAIQPLYKMKDASLHIGFAASYRTPKSDYAPNKWGSVRISTRNATAINRKKYLDTGNINDINFEMMMNVELAGHWRGLRVEAAYLQDNVHIEKGVENNSTKHFYGTYVQAGMLLFGGHQNYDSKHAEYTRITPGRSWGDVELCGRFDRLDLDSQGIYGGAANAWALGVNYYVNPNIKFMLNWQYVKNNKYANGNGDYVVGYDSAGAPTTNPADVASDSSKIGLGYNMLACRFEVNF